MIKKKHGTYFIKFYPLNQTCLLLLKYLLILKTNPKVVTDDPKVVTNTFNRFFCSITKTLAKNISHSNIPTYRNYMTNRISLLIFLSTPSINNIINIIIYSLYVNKAVGHDNIPAFFLHSAPPPLRPICNVSLISFTHGTFG